MEASSHKSGDAQIMGKVTGHMKKMVVTDNSEPISWSVPEGEKPQSALSPTGSTYVRTPPNIRDHGHDQL